MKIMFKLFSFSYQTKCISKINRYYSVENISKFKLPESPKRECYELQIPVPWGYLRGKWWGPLDKRPIVGFHGWQESCGSFDRFAPLLPKHTSFLTLDAIGQGYSSPFPNGMNYSIYDEPIVLRKLVKLFEWDRVSLLTHSQGNMKGLPFAAMYPKLLDFYIAIDMLYPLTFDNAPNMWKIFGKRVDKFWESVENIAKGGENPSYPYDECVNKMIKGSYGSLTPETTPYILERAIRPSTKSPNQYYFVRDLRLRNLYVPSLLYDECLHLVQHIKCPLFSIRTKNQVLQIDENYFNEIMKRLEKSCHVLEQLEVTASHHVHLLEPELIIKPVTDFIEKYYDRDNQTQNSDIVKQFIIEKYH